jgi:hypothetical protein
MQASNLGKPVSFPAEKHPHAGLRIVFFTSSIYACSVLKEVDAKAPLVDVDRTIADLRRCRDSMVQTITQYLFVYRIIIEAIKLNMTKKPEAPAAEVRRNRLTAVACLRLLPLARPLTLTPFSSQLSIVHLRPKPPLRKNRKKKKPK